MLAGRWKVLVSLRDGVGGLRDSCGGLREDVGGLVEGIGESEGWCWWVEG